MKKLPYCDCLFARYMTVNKLKRMLVADTTIGKPLYLWRQDGKYVHNTLKAAMNTREGCIRYTANFMCVTWDTSSPKSFLDGLKALGVGKEHRRDIEDLLKVEWNHPLIKKVRAFPVFTS